MDGQLKRITDRTFEGTLNHYTVQVFSAPDGWHAAVITPKPRQFTRIVLSDQTMAGAARRAREWIEANPFEERGLLSKSVLHQT